MAQQMILDFITPGGEQFLKTADQIKTGISARVRNELKPELQTYMREVQDELDAVTVEGASIKRTPTERAGLLLAVFQNEHLSPAVLLVRQCLEHAVVCQKEIDELMFIFHNLQEDQNALYRLSLDQVKKYGMIPLGEAAHV